LGASLCKGARARERSRTSRRWPLAAHGHFYYDKTTSTFRVIAESKPANAFLFKFIALLQASGTVPDDRHRCLRALVGYIGNARAFSAPLWQELLAHSGRIESLPACERVPGVASEPPAVLVRPFRGPNVGHGESRKEQMRKILSQKAHSRVAQLVEQLTVNQRVVGSSPTSGAISPFIGTDAVKYPSASGRPTSRTDADGSPLTVDRRPQETRARRG
jgi:hypothetical protein